LGKSKLELLELKSMNFIFSLLPRAAAHCGALIATRKEVTRILL
jgi:hypothetical protein